LLHSAGCEYAIRACAHLASQPQVAAVKIRQISEAEAIPGPFLSVVLPRLIAPGILASTRGPSGGYSLARPATEISLHDIVVAVDGLEALDRCAVGLGRCSDRVPCPLHDSWKPVRERVRAYLKQTTVAAMAEAITAKQGVLGFHDSSGL
jgi:Rrf2 family protein